MIGRWRTIPPARDPVAPGAVVRAALGRDPLDEVLGAVRERLRARYGASRVVLTRSGTDALTLALRLAARTTGTERVALPAWSCYAVATAAAGSGTRACFFDLDPATLAADPGTTRAALERGVGAVVVAHLYGHPGADADLLRELRDAGALLVEDAAQGAGARLAGRRLGALGDLTVLSFGRGKGVTCGGGGALLVRGSRIPDGVVEDLRRSLPEEAGGRPGGWTELGIAAAQWALGRPSLYRLPAAIPFLGLGETHYREPAPPEPIGDRAARLLREALADSPGPRAGSRRRRARRLETLLEPVESVRAVRPVPRAVPGALRFPFRLQEGRVGCPPLGVLRGYPRLLPELGVVDQPTGAAGTPTPGAAELRDTLLTAPTHPRVEERDLRAIAGWVERRPSAAGPGRDAAGRPGSPRPGGARRPAVGSEDRT